MGLLKKLFQTLNLVPADAPVKEVKIEGTHFEVTSDYYQFAKIIQARRPAALYLPVGDLMKAYHQIYGLAARGDLKFDEADFKRLLSSAKFYCFQCRKEMGNAPKADAVRAIASEQTTNPNASCRSCGGKFAVYACLPPTSAIS